MNETILEDSFNDDYYQCLKECVLGLDPYLVLTPSQRYGLLYFFKNIFFVGASVVLDNIKNNSDSWSKDLVIDQMQDEIDKFLRNNDRGANK